MGERGVFECGLCSFRYDETVHRPLNLPCGHVFCESCLTHLSQSDSLRCPVHKEKLTLQVKDLPPALTIFKFLLQAKPKEFSCAVHAKKIRYRCKVDNRYLCHACILEHAGAGHYVENCVVTVQSVKAQSEDVRKLLTRKSTIFQDLKKSIDSEERKVKSNCETQIRTINTVYDEAVSLLNSKRRELVATLKDNLNRQMQVIDGEKGRVVKQLEAAIGLMGCLGKVNYEGAFEEVIRTIEAVQAEVKSMEEGRPLDLPLYAFENGVKVTDLSVLIPRAKGSSKQRAPALEIGKFWICQECSMPNSSDMRACGHCSPRKAEHCDFSRSVGTVHSPKGTPGTESNSGFESKAVRIGELTRKPSLKTVPIKADLQVIRQEDRGTLTRRGNGGRGRKHSRHASVKKHNNSF